MSKIDYLFNVRSFNIFDFLGNSSLLNCCVAGAFYHSNAILSFSYRSPSLFRFFSYSTAANFD